ncbi:hypothetical protein GCM10008957_35540 [Deinococcus ruber]|uniref:Knr4/Smi1-like domain-containing protein n=1 Tax=Deinococcus ruber TaxID=1848197 RepID=A0A918CEN7_9DEIO|nr:hypothetical protein GCM10008957_35540 [Deinococcus ruber]
MNPEQIVRLNRDLWADRETPWMADGSSWPPHVLVIGEDGGGNFAAIDLLASDGRIWWYDHDALEGSLVEIAPNIQVYAEQVIAQFQQNFQLELQKREMNRMRLERKRRARTVDP